ncbi:MAG: hypothetical protein PF693_10220 [Spirochaetia bacterium]|jgi:hypothetical protein|nr:hypothetical protein [Spirochaetia bacterium]
MAGKMSIQGVQPKTSAVLDEKNNVFKIVAAGNIWINSLLVCFNRKKLPA